MGKRQNYPFPHFTSKRKPGMNGRGFRIIVEKCILSVIMTAESRSGEPQILIFSDLDMPTAMLICWVFVFAKCYNQLQFVRVNYAFHNSDYAVTSII